LKHFIFAGCAAILISCTTTEQANEALSSKYIGKPVDQFFIENGPPSSQYNTQDGRTIFVWAESPQSITIPGSSYTTVTGYGNTATAYTNYSPATNIDIQCQVRIVASRAGKIEQILSQKDSSGVWEMSRCNEIFGQK
jgi:hypothetical protein